MEPLIMCIKEFIGILREPAWLLGICINGFDDLKNGRIVFIHNGKYEGKKWFADPYILDYDDKIIHLLVEEFDYKVRRGRIAKLTIDRNLWLVTDCKIILDLNTHLSFPMIWRKGNDVLVCPENYHSGGWHIYRYNPKMECLDYLQQLQYEKLTDATIWKNDNIYWLLSTYEPSPNGSELTIWKADNLNGPYKESQRVKFDENIGRNAGMIFQDGDTIIRPAQESNNVYGHSISFQKITFKDDTFDFKEIYRFHSPHPIYDAGTHTYNQYKEMAVIDVKGYRHRKMAKLFSAVGSTLVKLGLKKPFVIQ